MTAGLGRLAFVPARTRSRSRPEAFGSVGLHRAQPWPLLCYRSGCRWQMKGAHQVQGGVPQRQAMDRRPQVDHVPLLATVRVATEDILGQVDAEASAAVVA